MRTDSPEQQSLPATSGVRRRFVFAAAFAGLWMIGLAVLSLRTSNPVTLNRDQILAATDVLTAVVEDAEAGQVRVDKSWKDVVHEDHLRLSNLHELRVSHSERLLIPITGSRRDWQVAPSKLPPNGPPIVYPVTPESERQLRHLLRTARLP